ncbi:MAG: hypothetical protein ACYTKD_16745 [Planctomycetota bacterium]
MALVEWQSDSALAVGQSVSLRGRVDLMMFESVPRGFLFCDTTRSRWTGASVAGLVVGAMGVVIFTLHLRRWLSVRRGPAGSEGTP